MVALGRGRNGSGYGSSQWERKAVFASGLGAALEVKADQWKQRAGRRGALEPPLGQSYPVYRWGGVCSWAGAHSHPIGV